jgi:hypothetical protein
MQEMESYKQFKRALAPRDQRALDELFIYAGKHVAEAQYTSFEITMVTFLLAIILEDHKEVLSLQEKINGRNQK